MFCTTIIPTVGRMALDRAVKSVLQQDFSQGDYEIIVINDSGTGLSEREWESSPYVSVMNTNHRERCVARNVGAALARGQYLHFLDDDDWLLPGALNIFLTLAQKHQDSAWLYGGTVLFDRDDQPIIRLVHNLPPNCFVQVMAGEWIPLQSSMIRHDCFHKVGGFNPLIPGIEDIDLARRMAFQFELQGTSELVSGVGMGEAGSTTNQGKARLEGRQARELILNEPGTFTRFRQSANTNYWSGRIVRVYLTSSFWNLSHRKFFTALSRMLYGMTAILGSIFTSLFSKSYWRAITGPYQSETFARGNAESTEKTCE
jgi:glycosyltransferase involved in cell wall biosynthesis